MDRLTWLEERAKLRKVYDEITHRQKDFNDFEAFLKAQGFTNECPKE